MIVPFCEKFCVFVVKFTPGYRSESAFSDTDVPLPDFAFAYVSAVSDTQLFPTFTAIILSLLFTPKYIICKTVC